MVMTTAATNYALFLAIVAAVVHVLLGAVQSNTFSKLLATFRLPALPAWTMPYLGLGLGLLSTAVPAVQAGEPWSTALLKGALGLAAGGAAALHLEALRTPPANDNAKRGNDTKAAA